MKREGRFMKNKKNAQNRMSGLNQAGFSLLEVLISTLIFGGICSAFAFTFGMMSHQHSHQRVRNQALDIASSLAEEVMSWTSSDVRLDNSFYLYYDEMGRDSRRPEKFKARWTPQPNTPIPGMTQVKLEVEWEEKGQTQVVSLRVLK